MKAFEKWWNNAHREIWLSRSTKKVAAEDGWKAALEWALNQDSGFCQCGCIEEFIEEELGIESDG